MHYTTSCNTQSSAPEDGRDQRPKLVELIGIINKPLSLHLVGVYIIYINDVGQENIKFPNLFQIIRMDKGNVRHISGHKDSEGE